MSPLGVHSWLHLKSVNTIEWKPGRVGQCMLHTCKLDIIVISGTAVGWTIKRSANRTDSVLNESVRNFISDWRLANDTGLTAGRSVLHYRVPTWGSHDYIELINMEEYCVEGWIVECLNQKHYFMSTNCTWVGSLKCKCELISLNEGC